MPKVIVQLYPVIPATNEEERTALRPLGRNVERYQQTLTDWNELVVAMDQMGIWGCATIEHHFHSEGYEVGPQPGILNGYWAAITENIRIGQLGYTMSTQDPFRVAEETAVLDHLTRGRCFVGFSRGYQNRWTDVLGQHLGTPTAHSDGSESDQRNREIFEDNVDIVLKSWTQESIDHHSPQWQVPYPYESGIHGWEMGDYTRQMGAPGEMGPDGELRRVSVVPAPYSDPHPQVFVASNASRATVEYAGRMGFVPTYFSNIATASGYGPAYVEAAAAAGKQYALGQNQAIVRWPRTAATNSEAHAMAAEYDGDIFKHFYSGFFPKGIDVPTISPDATRESLTEIMDQTGLWAIGSVPEVRDDMVAQWKQLPAEYCVLIYHFAQQPKESVIEQLQVFMDEIEPALEEVINYEAG
jgi:alkanesulfonate monooxygenase SsuD/methylene tetrahydromethanopterin reductase-like flavin-dependent oxidoreductase (luciferase family)